MARSRTSHQWLKAHHSDPFVLQARQEGYRSRAVYKLQELQDKYRLIRPGQCVVDLGAAPGGWSQYAAEILQNQGKLIALDRLEMDSLPGVTFVQGDFQKEATWSEVLALCGGMPVDVLLSDMAPNTIGVDRVDKLKSVQLLEDVVACAEDVLAPGGTLLAKVFQGAGVDAILLALRQRFTKVMCRKPKASRTQSSEVYVLAIGYKV